MNDIFEMSSSLLHLSQQGISTQHLSPMQVLSVIQHAQLRLHYEFTEQDFLDGKVGEKLVPEDFDFEENVSYLL